MKRLLPLVLLAVVASMSFASAANARGTFGSGELAPEEVCPNQADPELGAAEQVEAMLCLTNFARSVNGLRPLRVSTQLGHAAEQKSIDIIGCDQFSHEACGRPFTYWDQRYGYLRGCWKAAENIAWGTGALSTVRTIFTAWLESPEHHANILGPYREIGIGLRVGELEGNEGAAVWTQDFGSHRC
ncbi:MAG: CAP domain-containing protein [Actinobacteria bacterium]|nr:CAP domain-containing protein [Actinomycetota bacterium]